ncbi:GNAT family N-acetyltransferase [Kribbella sp. CA-293567]|uniref:GNAT family N-acetyltransferase n=1 Tax=Kribbella sp. CA-293567 TaxID=3002436 RepID=UPI0022DE5CBF|nr:GNAT family N-acetyltransferase [Kribbella sp. CA-293567]WBQ06137.1 GNAT family N-acetyltransferase [Kribbella sp. CA-293567]
MQRQDYTGPDDLRALQELVRRTYSVDSRFHVGDLAWEYSSAAPARQAGWRLALWREGNEVFAWGWVEGNDLLMVVDPARPDLATEVLAWFRESTEAESLGCSVLESETHLIEALAADGFRVHEGDPFFTHHTLALTDLSTPVVPAGFTLRPAQLHEVEQRAAVHRAAWSDLQPSKVTAQVMGAVMSTWPYRPELDWVVVAPDGEFVASALIWLDEENQAGLVEPVGCAPAYRRQGLAQAVNLGALHALRDLGGVEARVCPRGDDDYPQARRLYQSIGFQPGLRTVNHRLDL